MKEKSFLNLPFGYSIGKKSNNSNSFNKKKLNSGDFSNRLSFKNYNRKSDSFFTNKETWLNILTIIFFLAIILIVSYVVCFTIKYFTTKCDEKRRYGSYLFRFRWNDVCKCSGLGDDVDLTNVYYMNQVPGTKKKDVVETDLEKLEGKPQVFHIANQDYTYDQAQCKCASYDARLATYPELVDAYNNGANWCSYGWSKGQTAYYPTQKCVWKKMQNTDKKNDCGKPGINGGFFGDPYLKFGVNCFGKKPEGKIVKIKDKKCPEKDYCEMPQNYFASHRLKTDEIAPFNENKWNEFEN